MRSIKTVDKDGTIRYRNENGYLHREDGPAFEGTDGHKVWFINGKRHREDGPAIEYPDGDVRYYLNDIYYDSKEDWELEVLKIKLGRIKDL